jgi:hypothetical protein
MQVAGRALVTRGGHHRDVMVPVCPQRCVHAGRNAVSAVAKSAGLLTADCLTRTMLMVAPGATACTISVSSTSSPPASQGEAEPAR